MIFNVFEIQNQKGMDIVLDHMNKVANTIYEERLQYCIENISNEASRIIFLDWWYGGCLWGEEGVTEEETRAKRYQNVPKEIWEEAYGYIMETVSLGMG